MGYDAWKLATPPEYTEHHDLDDEHEALCCDEHYTHHEHSPSSEWPLGGCFTCEAVVLRTCRTLASNLATAAGLCEAFGRGEYFERAQWANGWRLDVAFRPGHALPAAREGR